MYFAEKSSKAVMPEAMREQRGREGTSSDGKGQLDMTRGREGESSEGDTERGRTHRETMCGRRRGGCSALHGESDRVKE